jgi:hypothetical protein
MILMSAVLVQMLHFCEARSSGEDAQTGQVSHPPYPGAPRRAFSQARPQAEQEPEAYPLGHVEDFDEPRTLLADFLSILLGELVLCHAIPKCIAGELEEPACFGNIAACALQRFL